MAATKGSFCVRYEMTQREFRARLAKQWCPTFIKKFGDLATGLFKDLYGKAPPKAPPAKEDHVGGNLYPVGILRETYRRLIEAGEPEGEPYQLPDPKGEWKEPTARLSKRLVALGDELARQSYLRQVERRGTTNNAVPPQVRQSFSHGRTRDVMKRLVARRVAAINELARLTYGQEFDQLSQDKRSEVISAYSRVKRTRPQR